MTSHGIIGITYIVPGDTSVRGVGGVGGVGDFEKYDTP